MSDEKSFRSLHNLPTLQLIFYLNTILVAIVKPILCSVVWCKFIRVCMHPHFYHRDASFIFFLHPPNSNSNPNGTALRPLQTNIY